MVYLNADFSSEITELMRSDLENQRNNLKEETREMKENNLFKQMMDLENKIKSNELVIYNITQNIDDVLKSHSHFKNKLLSI